jgi:hypothetical protein
MSPGIQIEFHVWRGIGPTVQRDLFFYGWRFGFLTLSICRVCVIDSYAKLRAAVVERVEKDERNLGDD